MLFSILLLCLCTITFVNLLSVSDGEDNNGTKIVIRKQFRKQHGSIPPRLQLAIPQKKRGGVETYFEPYLEEGDWVYNRGVSTKRPVAYFLNFGNTTKHTSCNQICPKLYQDYNAVCGRRYDRHYWIHRYRSFPSLCYLELENCYSDRKRWGWIPAYRGNCTKRTSPQSFLHLKFEGRAKKYEAKIDIFN